MSLFRQTRTAAPRRFPLATGLVSGDPADAIAKLRYPFCSRGELLGKALALADKRIQ